MTLSLPSASSFEDVDGFRKDVGDENDAHPLRSTNKTQNPNHEQHMSEADQRLNANQQRLITDLVQSHDVSLHEQPLTDLKQSPCEKPQKQLGGYSDAPVLDTEKECYLNEQALVQQRSDETLQQYGKEKHEHEQEGTQGEKCTKSSRGDEQRQSKPQNHNRKPDDSPEEQRSGGCAHSPEVVQSPFDDVLRQDEAGESERIVRRFEESQSKPDELLLSEQKFEQKQELWNGERREQQSGAWQQEERQSQQTEQLGSLQSCEQRQGAEGHEGMFGKQQELEERQLEIETYTRLPDESERRLDEQIFYQQCEQQLAAEGDQGRAEGGQGRAEGDQGRAEEDQEQTKGDHGRLQEQRKQRGERSNQHERHGAGERDPQQPPLDLPFTGRQYVLHHPLLDDELSVRVEPLVDPARDLLPEETFSKTQQQQQQQQQQESGWISAGEREGKSKQQQQQQRKQDRISEPQQEPGEKERQLQQYQPHECSKQQPQHARQQTSRKALDVSPLRPPGSLEIAPVGAVIPPGSLEIPPGGGVRRKIMPSRDLLDDCEIDAALQRTKQQQQQKHQQQQDTCGASGTAEATRSRSHDNPLQRRASSSTTEEGEGEEEDGGDRWSDCDKTPESLETPDYFHDDVFDGQLGWNDLTPSQSGDVAYGRRGEGGAGKERWGEGDSDSMTSRVEAEENERWRTVQIGDRKHRIDLRAVEPYKRILSHGGYYGDGFNTIIVLTACYLPDKRRRDYHYVMRNLFLYAISTLELLVMDEYTVVYFHGSVPKQRMPSFRWLKQCYQMIDRRFKKNLKRLLIVHPTFFLRTIMIMSKPFISSKFYAKLKYVRSLEELCHLIPMDHVHMPPEIKNYDAKKNGKNSNNAT